MEALFLYIVKSSLCLSLLYIAYKLLLSRETFFAFNRYLILLGIAVAITLPMITVEIVSEAPSPIQAPIIYLENWVYEASPHAVSVAEVPVIENTTLFTLSDTTNVRRTISWITLLMVTYIVGMVANLCLLVISYLRVRSLINGGEQHAESDYILVILEDDITPFSWRHYIVLSRSDYNRDGEEILTHELAHIRNGHFWDILSVRVVMLLHWFNPLVWKLKEEMIAIHEYQADNWVVNSGIDATKYQLLLVKKAVGSSSYALANSLNHSKIKKRITMMLKQKSKKSNRLKSLLLIPIAMLSVYAFAYTSEKPTIEDKDTSLMGKVQEDTDFALPPASIETVRLELASDSSRKTVKFTPPRKTADVNKITVQFTPPKTAADSSKTTVKFTPPRKTSSSSKETVKFTPPPKK